MVIVKVIKDIHGGEEYLSNICHYVTDGRQIFVNGNGVNPHDTEAAVQQMMRVKEEFGKANRNPLVHLMVSYDDSVAEAGKACWYTDKIAEYFYPRHQTLQSTHGKHRGCSVYHAHIIVNACSYVDGKMLRFNYTAMHDFCKHVRTVTGCKTQLIYDEADTEENEETE